MRYTHTLTTALALALTACTANAVTDKPASAVPLLTSAPMSTVVNETPITFEAENGESVEAFAGTFVVPENRPNPDSRDLTIHYVRFPATTDTLGAPIVYLSGGPGGSGINTAKGQRFPLFMAMRQHGDVIAYDQRGTGKSNDMERCTRTGADLTDIVSDKAALAGDLAALASCMDEWEAAGVDLDGYDTVENAKDLEDLRQHLGAKQISLWGISYGSHLGLAALRELDGRIDRAVFASIEGLDQTFKLPARTDAYFDRLQVAMNAADSDTPDVKALIARVHAKFDAEPQLLDVDGTKAMFHRRDLQTLLSGAIADPKWAIMVVGIYRDLDRGDPSSLEQMFARWGVTSDHSYLPMNRLTDIASGTDPERRALIDTQGRTALIGTRLNAPYESEDIRPHLVLGPDFRRPVQSDVPVLMLSGTLDGRTYPEAAREAMVGLAHAHHVLIKDAGHNLFMTDPAVGDLIHQFMRGDDDLPKQITVPIPD